MNPEKLRELLEGVRAGAVSPEEALDRIKHLPFEDIGVATLDTHRELRCGVPEVIFCQGKTPEQTATITRRLLEADVEVLATRASRDQLMR